MPFAGRFAVTTPSPREFQLELEEREVQALRSRQRKTSRSASVLITRASGTWSYETRISGPVARVSGWSVGDTSRRARRPGLVGMQLRQYELQRSTFVLLAQRRASQADKNGSGGQGVADASGAERCIAGMEVAERLQRTRGFRFPVSSPQRKEATRPCCCPPAEDPACFHQSRHHWRRLAHVSAYGRDDAGRDGRTSTHDPRLFASQQSPRDEQVSSSNTGKQTSRARKTGGCDLAEWLAVGEQINSDSVVGAGACVLWIGSGEDAAGGVLRRLIGPKRTRILFWVCYKCLKIWRWCP